MPLSIKYGVCALKYIMIMLFIVWLHFIRCHQSLDHHLKVEPVRIVSMCVCVCVCLHVCPPPRLLITSGVMWRDIDPIRLVKQVL